MGVSVMAGPGEAIGEEECRRRMVGDERRDERRLRRRGERGV